MKLKYLLIFLWLFIINTRSSAGITGSIFGKVLDKNTRQELPGAIIMMTDIRLWTVADKYGNFIIQNIPPGVYNIRAKMLGYAPIVMKDVNISADFNLEINFEMASEALVGPEIEIVADQPLIQKEVAFTSYTLLASDINRKLPIDNLYQAINVQPSSINGHIRGGRKYDALCMIDGLSIQDPMFRDISTLVPLSAISGIHIIPGGFNAEYGQAMSGVINLVTKEGKERTEGFFKMYTDNFGIKIKNDNLRQMELSLGGPLILGFGGPMYDLNYYVSGTMNFDHIQFSNKEAQDMQMVPRGQNYHFTSKLSFKMWQKIKIILQSISSSWQLQHSNYASLISNENVSTDKKKESNRINFTIIHTLNPSSFYTFSGGRDIISRQHFNKIILAKELSPDFEAQLKSANLTSTWNDIVNERAYFLRASYYHQYASSNLFQIGVDLSSYRVMMNNLYLNQSPELCTFSPENFKDNLRVEPLTFACYAQNRIIHDKFVINIGMRFDYFNPDVTFPGKAIVSAEDTIHLGSRESSSQFQISPRAGLSFPFLLKNDRLHLNYGWFFQTPPLYYFYLNSQQNMNLPFPLIGNPDLEAEQTEAFEVGYQKALSSKTVFGSTFFVKKIENLVNTRLYYLGENQQENYFQFENLDRASIKGLEIFLEKRPGNNNIAGKISYTYCKAVGSGSFPLQNYYLTINNSVASQGFKRYPLAWDQRHKISCNLSYFNPKLLEINLLARFNSPLPILDQQFRIVGRSNWRNYVDLRIIKSFNLFKGNCSPYVEIVNLLDDQNQDMILNPYYQIEDYDYGMSEFGNYQYEFGRRMRIGLMINF